MEEYKKWLNKSEDDLLWTKSSLENSIWYGACFTAQQSVEKALKGFLIFHNKPLRKIHDIRALLEDCIVLDKSFESIKDYIIPLVAFYIETRYPSYEEVDRFTKEQAQEAYENAKTVLEFVKGKLSS